MRLPPFEWMERVIGIDSITTRSNEELVRFLVPLLKETGLKVVEQRVVENGVPFKNVIALSHEGAERDLLVLNTHLDTVGYGEAEDWTKTGGDPFKFTRVRDRVYGLGVADVKLDMLCKIQGAREARAQGGWRRPFALVGTFGEERSLNGAQALLKERKVAPRYALVGEPSNLELIYAHKGHLILRFAVPLGTRPAGRAEVRRWKGKSAHSATPDLGDNAIRKGLTDIRKRGYRVLRLEGGTGSNLVPDRCEAEVLPDPDAGTKRLFAVLERLEEVGRELKKRRDARFSPPTTTHSLNLARREGDDLVLTIDFRTLPDVELGPLSRKLAAAVEAEGCRVLDLVEDPPLNGSRNSRFIQEAARILKDVGVKPVKKTKATSTEAALYNQYGAEAIVFGPGVSTGNVHRPNEHNSLRQIGLATRFYAQILQTSPEEF